MPGAYSITCLGFLEWWSAQWDVEEIWTNGGDLDSGETFGILDGSINEAGITWTVLDLRARAG